MPNRPQTRIWLTVSGAKPRCGSTNGATTRPSAVSASISSGRLAALDIRRWRAHARPCWPSRPCGRSISTSVITANSMTCE